MLVGVNICSKKWKPGLKFGNGQFHCNGITFREIFFNHHSIAEHILTENLLIIEILLQVMKLVQFQEKI